jgi:hypothetical protein
VFGESEFERSLAEIAATERRLVEPQSGPELTEADWARARDTLAAAPPPPADAAEAAWIYQGPLDTYRVQRHIEKLRADHRIAHPDRVTRLGSKEFRDAAEALAPQARPP